MSSELAHKSFKLVQKSFELAQKVADAVLYEGYVLYPYRASAVKNRLRWQFGVVAPRGYAESGESEPWAMQTECLVEIPAGAEAEETPEIDLRVRFLQVQARTVEQAVDAASGLYAPVEALDVDGRRLVTWEEGEERRLDEAGISVARLLSGSRMPASEIPRASSPEERRELDDGAPHDSPAVERRIPIEIPGGCEIETVQAADGGIAGRIVRERWPILGEVSLAAEPTETPGLIKLRVRIENLGEWPVAGGGFEQAGREQALRRSLVGAHTLLAVRGGEFVSLLDPPPAAAAAAASCANLHTWPVLVGEPGSRDVVLSSPIILYDHPAVAPESPGDLCDATEIDEILTLRVMTLTEEEKREAMGTDERARQIVERSDAIPPELLERLHGAVRSLGPAALSDEKALLEQGALADWESFLNPPGVVPPEEASVEVGPVRVARGSRVRLRPSRRADTMDLFLAGRTARVEGVYRDVEDVAYVAVVLELDEDPAGDLHSQHGRFLYFYPEEVEPLGSDDRDRSDLERRTHATSDPGPAGASRGGSRNPVVSGSGPVPEDAADVEDVEAGAPVSHRALVAGVGNIFLGDDGFGVEVVRRLAARPLPDGVRVADFGIRGIHLAYELLEKGYESTILVDATPRGGEPGTVYLIEPNFESGGHLAGQPGEEGPPPADAHGMDPRAVFGLLANLGGTPGRLLIVGCEPATTEEEMGLSAPVEAAVEEAVTLILELLEREAGSGAPAAQPTG